MIKRILLICCIAGASHAQRPLKWIADATQTTPVTFDCSRGETLTFTPTLKAYGVTLTNYTASFQWQTNGMGTAFWSTNALIFTPAMDCGANRYRFFIRAESTNGVMYSAQGTINMLHAPGAIVNALPLPVQRIDFSTTSYTNAPWVLPSELSNSNNWNNAFGWGNHSGLYRPIDWLPSWSQVTDKPTEFTPSAHTQAWSTITNPPESISTALQVETDAIALNAIATNRVMKLWDTSGTQFVDATGAVWRISTIVQTNYGVSVLSALNSYGVSSPETWYDIPSFDDGWTTEIFQDNAYLWYDKGGMGQCAWVAHLDFADSEAGVLEMRLSLELSQQNLPYPPEGVAYFCKTFTYYQVTNLVDTIMFASGSEKELHRDSATNVIWRTVWSNGWMWVIAYTNYPTN